MRTDTRLRWGVAALILLALLLVPAPLLPPHRLAGALERLTGLGWKAAYLLAALALRGGFYGALGLLATLATPRSPSPRTRLLWRALAPIAVIVAALVIRSAKVGHPPLPVHALVPSIACIAGAALGGVLFHRAWKAAGVTAVVILAASFWGLTFGVSGELRGATADRLQRLVDARSELPEGEARFGALIRTAFAPTPPPGEATVEGNRAAILALAIAIGHERLARYAGLDREDPLVQEAALLREGTTLRGRGDLPRHYLLSAGLAVVENPLVSDAGGLLKEELDALARGTGFSFVDLAADRAGVRFAVAATASESRATALRARLHEGFAVDDYFPPLDDLPENLTPEEFRSRYGRMGSPRYREAVEGIEARIDRCAGLADAGGR